jgi:hypothetical protein
VRKGSSSRCGLVSAVVTQLSSSAGGSSPGPGAIMVSATGTGLPQASARDRAGRHRPGIATPLIDLAVLALRIHNRQIGS